MGRSPTSRPERCRGRLGGKPKAGMGNRLLPTSVGTDVSA
jgi:hypothetical protein